MRRIFNPDTKDYDLVPSENYGPNKMLVTDVDGNPRWEDKPFYKSGLIEVKLSPKNTYSDPLPNGHVRYLASDRDLYDLPSEVRSAFRAIDNDFAEHQNERTDYAAYWDGVRYTKRITRLPGSIYFGDSSDPYTPYMMVSTLSSGIQVSVVFSDEAEHTFAFETFNCKVKRLDESYMPLLTDANGVKYQLTVGTDGTLSITVVDE